MTKDQTILPWLWRLDTRILEIALGLELLRRGMVWLTSGATLSEPYYASLASVAGVTFWGVLFVIAGLCQIGGVVINGNWHRSPLLRCAVLAFSVTMYSVLARSFMSFSTQSATQEVLSAITCAWCLFNIASKAHVDGK